MAGGKGVSAKGGSELRTPFKDAIFTPKGISSPAPVNPNKAGKK
jgi:hypothetical protein